MRRPRRRHQDESLSLFPFLAVLICTMGSLIVLLVVVVQQARVHADTVTASRNQEKAAADRKRRELLQQIGQHQRQIDQMRRSLAAHAQQVASDEQRLGALQKQTRQLEQQSQQLEQMARQLNQQTAAQQDQLSLRAEELEKLKAELLRSQTNFEQLQREAALRGPSYALVPYDGPSGTQRRPIYIECLADRIVLQPEQVTLFENDFEGPLTAENPLAMALRAIRAYLARSGDIAPYEMPYPLLIVRPDGARSYAAARTAMSWWDAEFGYELIDRDMQLAYPPPDPALAQTLRQIVSDARERQARIRRSRNIQSGRGPGYQFEASPRRGGFVRRGPAERGDSPGRTQTRAGGAERTTGRQAATGLSAYPSPPTPGTASGETGQGLRIGTQPRGETGQSAFPEFANSREAGRGELTGNATSDQGPAVTEMSPPRARQPGPSHPTATVASTGTKAAPTDTIANDSSSKSTSPSVGDDVQREWGTSGITSNPSSQSRDEVGPSPHVSAGGQPAGGQNPAARDRQSETGDDDALHSFAEIRGRNWALPNGGNGALGIARPILVQCYFDRFVLRPEPGSQQRSLSVPIDRSARNAIQSLVEALEQRVHSWGIAGPGAYWKPELQVAVAPGAELRFEQLRASMKDSGIHVVKR